MEDSPIEAFREIQFISEQDRLTGVFGAVLHLTASDESKPEDIERFNETSQIALLENGTEDHMKDYLYAVEHVDLLTPEEEKRYGTMVQTGLKTKSLCLEEGREPTRAEQRLIHEGESARDYMVRTNMRMVVSIAKRYPLPKGMDLLDLVQEGNIGLDRAVRKFDPERGFKFYTYAQYWVKQAIGRALDKHGSTIKLPGAKAAALRSTLRNEAGDLTKLSAEQAQLRKVANPISLDKTVNDSKDASLVDLVPHSEFDPANMSSVIYSDIIEKIFSELSTEESRILTLRFGLVDGKQASFREIADDFGVTSEAIRRKYIRIIKKVKDNHPEVDLSF